jgi:hypothetical protein
MPYCSQCGVEVHENTEDCPLCQAPIQKGPLQEHPERNYPDQASAYTKLPPLTLRERLRLAREISVILFLIPILFSISIDLFMNRHISWSAYVILALVGALLITIVPLFLPQKKGWVNLLIHLILSGVCLGLNGLTGWDFAWSLTLALPILLTSWLIIQGILWLRRFRHGPILAASILVGIGLLCLVVDATLRSAFSQYMQFGWSLIVISALAPTALLLLYLYRKKSRLRRFFHV